MTHDFIRFATSKDLLCNASFTDKEALRAMDIMEAYEESVKLVGKELAREFIIIGGAALIYLGKNNANTNDLDIAVTERSLEVFEKATAKEKPKKRYQCCARSPAWFFHPRNGNPVRIQLHKLGTLLKPHCQLSFLSNVIALPAEGYMPSIAWLIMLKAKAKLEENKSRASDADPQYGVQDMCFMIGRLVNEIGNIPDADFGDKETEDLLQVAEGLEMKAVINELFKI